MGNTKPHDGLEPRRLTVSDGGPGGLTGLLDRARHRMAWFGRRRRVRSRGLRFTLQCDNAITRLRWRTYNSKEPQTLDWIDTHVRDGDTVFDIGANIGSYTIYAALRHPSARLIAFEPEYANLYVLRNNLLENGLQDRVQVYSIALSNRTGLSRLQIQDLTPGAALHTESREPLSRTRTRRRVIWREGISTYTLDAFCQESGLRPDCLKLDVDGTEAEVLEGAARTLASQPLRTLMVEMPDDQDAYAVCQRLLLEAGLRCEWRNPSLTVREVWVRAGSG